jgi:hypothetical protein
MGKGGFVGLDLSKIVLNAYPVSSGNIIELELYQTQPRFACYLWGHLSVHASLPLLLHQDSPNLSQEKGIEGMSS